VQQQLEEHAAALQEMQDALTRQSGQIAELQERVDFAERMLAQARDRQKLGSP
jgi:chromosome segregation ATPase